MPMRPPRRILCVTNHKALPPHVISRMEKDLELVSATRAADGYVLARTQQFDLFLFGDRLQTGSGIELCKRVRTFDAQTPAIILVASGGKGRAERALDAQAQLVLSTPLDSDFLFEAIRGLIANPE